MCTLMRFVELTPDPARDRFTLPRRLAVLRGLEPFERVQVVGLVHAAAMGEEVMDSKISETGRRSSVSISSLICLKGTGGTWSCSFLSSSI